MKKKEDKVVKLRIKNVNEVYSDLMPNNIHKLDKYRYIFLYGGASSGKTYVKLQSSLLMCFLDAGRQVMVFRKNSSTARKTVFKALKSILKDLDLEKLMNISINETYMEIKFENGSMISCSGADDVEKLKSLPDLDDIILEEATDFSLEDFKQITLRLRGKKKHKHIYLMLNPVSKENWTYKYFFENVSEQVKEKTYYLKTTYKDNQFIDPEEAKEIEGYKETDPLFYQVYGLGEWGVIRGKVFNNVRQTDLSEEQIYKQLKSKNTNYDTRFGMDFGYDDPTVILKVVVDNDESKIYILDEVYESELTLRETAEIIKEKRWKNVKILADSAGKTQIQSLNKDYNLKDIKAVKKPKIKESVDNLKSYEIIVCSNCQNTYMELENYEQFENGKFSEKNNHAIDALRYAMTERGTTWTYIENLNINIFKY